MANGESRQGSEWLPEGVFLMANGISPGASAPGIASGEGAINMMDSSIFAGWQTLHGERLAEAAAALSAVPGVRGLVLGGSMGRGEHWPMSDIDILPISAVNVDTEEEIARRQCRLVNWWAASGRAQTLDVGWLCFTDQEVEEAVASGVEYAAMCMQDRRWFHGVDKAYGGRGVADSNGLAQAFADWATAMRFEQAVIDVRRQVWTALARSERERAARAVASGDLSEATMAIRESARALRLVLLEGWGERLGSMGREWTRFEHMAVAHDAQDIAERLARLADSHPDNALQRAATAPVWLQERIRLTFIARQVVAEDISEAENARDQLAAFAVHVPKHQSPPWDDWLGIPAPDLDDKLTSLNDLLNEIL